MTERSYFDTSVLVKRYVDEDGSTRARAGLRRYRVVTSSIAPLEALSAFLPKTDGGWHFGGRLRRHLESMRADIAG